MLVVVGAYQLPVIKDQLVRSPDTAGALPVFAGIICQIPLSNKRKVNEATPGVDLIKI
jgi:hypothetical protein